jgi:transposase
MAKKYRSFSPEFKFQIVLEVLTGAKRPSEVCREHQICDSVLSRWRKQFLEQGPQIFTPASKPNQDDTRTAELERVIGQLTLELAAAKKASNWLDSLP